MNKKRKECVAMLLAGGQGSRLYALTKSTAKPAVTFGGKYRIIDFPLTLLKDYPCGQCFGLDWGQ